MQRREHLGGRLVGPLHGRQAEQDGALRVFVDGQRRQPGELAALAVSSAWRSALRRCTKAIAAITIATTAAAASTPVTPATPPRTGDPVAVHLLATRNEEAPLVVAELEARLGGPRLGQLEPAPAVEEAGIRAGVDPVACGRLDPPAREQVLAGARRPILRTAPSR